MALRCAGIAANYMDCDTRKHGVLVRTVPVVAWMSGTIRREFDIAGINVTEADVKVRAGQ